MRPFFSKADHRRFLKLAMDDNPGARNDDDDLLKVPPFSLSLSLLGWVPKPTYMIDL